MIPFKNRFHGHKSLGYVYRNGQAVRSRLFTIKFTDNKHRKESRLAVVVSKKIFKSAVRRNRIRRRVYEYIRPILSEFDKAFDIAVIVTSAEVQSIEHSDLAEQIDQLLDQSGMRKANTGSQKQ